MYIVTNRTEQKTKSVEHELSYDSTWRSDFEHDTYLAILVGLRPDIHSWLRFQPEDECDGKVILPRR